MESTSCQCRWKIVRSSERDSTISGDVLLLGNTQIIDLRNGAMLDVGADATINMQVDTYERYALPADHLIDASSGSQLVNNGINL